MADPFLDARLQLRPQIETAPAESVAEDFQNRCLRPILKLQHPLLVQLFGHHAARRNYKLVGLSAEKKRQQIQTALQQDTRLRGLLFGLVLGQCTEAELAQYCQMESEMNRRLGQLLLERLHSHYG